jgi:hypothetical protein
MISPIVEISTEYFPKKTIHYMFIYPLDNLVGSLHRVLA